PSFETFLSAPVTLGDYLRSQLSVSLISEDLRNAAESIIGNLDEDGYLSASLEEIASVGEHKPEQVEEALRVVQSLDPAGVGARVVEPDVYFIKDGDDYIIQMNDEDVPQLRLNAQYRRMLDRDNGATKEVRDYVRERYTSAIQLMKNIEQRKQTILKVCQAIVRRQTEFLGHGLDYLKPMMIKEVAEEVGVHPSTVSRAVAGKYVHTPQGVFELRYFFSE